MTMRHAIHEVRSFEIVAPYVLCVCFEDGTAQIIDLQPILAGELYGPLRDVELFNRVRIDPGARTLVWPNGADSTQPRSTTGPNTSTKCASSHGAGRRPGLERQEVQLKRDPETIANCSDRPGQENHA